MTGRCRPSGLTMTAHILVIKTQMSYKNTCRNDSLWSMSPEWIDDDCPHISYKNTYELLKNTYVVMTHYGRCRPSGSTRTARIAMTVAMTMTGGCGGQGRPRSEAY